MKEFDPILPSSGQFVVMYIFDDTIYSRTLIWKAGKLYEYSICLGEINEVNAGDLVTYLRMYTKEYKVFVK